MSKLSTHQRRIKKVCMILLVTVFSYVILSMIGSVIIFQVIFSRSGKADAFELTYQDVDHEQYPRQELTFLSGSNRLYGCLYRAEGESKGLVLLSNGMNCLIDRHLPEILYFVDHGFSVMTYENTGVGDSEGSGTIGIPQARLDLEAAIDYIRKDQELSRMPLVLYGHSLGGYAVTTALLDEKDVCAVVCVSAFNSPNENMLHHAKRYVGFLADWQYPFMCLQNYFLFGNISNDAAVDAINETQIPVMIVCGNSDDIVTDDISLLKKANQITNPNVITVEISEPYRGEHNTVWLSREAAEYLEKTEHPDDKERANELDEDYMENVIAFYDRSIRPGQSSS